MTFEGRIPLLCRAGDVTCDLCLQTNELISRVDAEGLLRYTN